MSRFFFIQTFLFLHILLSHKKCLLLSSINYTYTKKVSLINLLFLQPLKVSVFFFNTYTLSSTNPSIKLISITSLEYTSLTPLFYALVRNTQNQLSYSSYRIHYRISCVLTTKISSKNNISLHIYVLK